ncbi:alkaline shock response membrane anchor protein AmaP [Paenibacillus ginsengihumi]|uniref:alkaline shock response membrane anchor protein AmaP n=1 Tax=Paenibacillus ginsengihumi TaxID=431596 RepID=UPI0003678AD6|nr:alkaline shock response membrane anchor protein AmaP [Paenibacillus ginsengihumi]
MVKVLDRLLLMLFSLAILVVALILLTAGFGLIGYRDAQAFVSDVYSDMGTAVPFLCVTAVMALISIRFLYVSFRSGRASAPSIDQRTEYGDIRISLDTVENLALKAAGRTRGLKDLRARVNVSQAGIEITVRALVDGEHPIPGMTEELQANIKSYVEEITGIPVASVSVFVANIQSSTPTFKSRVE